MSALMRFLSKDAAAKAVVLAALALTPAAAHAAPESGPGGTISAETILAALQGEAANLGKVVGLLQDSTDRCLSGQARLLQGVGGDADAARAAVRSRRAEIRETAGTDTSLRDAQRVLSSGHLKPEDQDRLGRHVRLRNACLAWAERSVDTLGGLLADGPGVSAGLERAREMAARDMERLASLGSVLDGHGKAEIQAMETAGPRM